MCQPVRCFGTLVFQPRKVALCCVVHSAGASPRATQALQLRGHVFCTCTGALAIRRAIQYKPPDQCSCCHNMHAWLLEQPCPSVRKEFWYAVCFAALIAMLISRGLMFSTLARSGLKPVAVKARAIDLLHAALTDFAARQGSVSVLSDSSQALPFVCARPNSFLTVSL